MELKLTIYGKENGQRVVEKTYTADTYTLLFGTLEDFIQAVDLDAIMGCTTDSEFISEVAKAITQGFDLIAPLFMDVFPGLTKEELRRAPIQEMVSTVLGILTYTMSGIFKTTNGRKNR